MMMMMMMMIMTTTTTTTPTKCRTYARLGEMRKITQNFSKKIGKLYETCVYLRI
jgi:NRPS condensation-like uncharacterized protein